MPRGRQPEGEHALSNAERQARYRARRKAEATATQGPLPSADGPTHQDLSVGTTPLPSCSRCKAEYAAWYEALARQPDATMPTAEALVGHCEKEPRRWLARI